MTTWELVGLGSLGLWGTCVVALTVRGIRLFEARFAEKRIRYAPRIAAVLVLLGCAAVAADAVGLISLFGSDSDLPPG